MSKPLKVEDKLLSQLYEAIIDKLKQNDEDSSFFLRFDLNNYSKKINRTDFLRAMETLQIRLSEQDALMLSRTLDPDNEGFYDLSALMKEIGKFEAQKNNFDSFKSPYDRTTGVSQVEEKALRLILDDIYSFCKKSKIFINFFILF